MDKEFNIINVPEVRFIALESSDCQICNSSFIVKNGPYFDGDWGWISLCSSACLDRWMYLKTHPEICSEKELSWWISMLKSSKIIGQKSRLKMMAQGSNIKVMAQKVVHNDGSNDGSTPPLWGVEPLSQWTDLFSQVEPSLVEPMIKTQKLGGKSGDNGF